MSVPSNLIPTRISQLPVDPNPSLDSWLMVNHGGVTYQVQASDLVAVSGVPTSRQVIAGTGLTGGGALSANVTLSIATGGVGTTQLASTGVTEGSYGSSSEIPVFTVDAKGRITAASSEPLSTAGLVPATRQVIAGDGLTGGGNLNSNVTLSVDYGSALPLNGSSLGVTGSSLEVSRSDHQHPAVELAEDDQVNGVLGLDNGGTGASLTPVAGGFVWSGGDHLYVGAAGEAGQVLVSGGSGAYSWGSAFIISDQAANIVYAGPASGGSGPTSFRSLVAADLPEVPFSQITDTPTTLSGYGITDAQPLDSDLTALAGLSTTGLIVRAGSGSVTTRSLTAADSYITVTDGSGVSGNPTIALTYNGFTIGSSNIPLGGTISSLTGLSSITLTTGPANSLDVATKGYVDTSITSLSLGTMSTQDAGSVAVTGGSINGTSLGATTRSTAALTTGLVGPAASANFTRFPNALVAVSNVDVSIQQNESLNIGMIGEAASASTVSASGLYGAGYTNASGSGRGTGITGEGHVSSSADTGSAVGVRGYAIDIHAGDSNIGLYGQAQNGAHNYALYLSSGDIYTNAEAKTWYLNGTLTFSGAHTVTIPAVSSTTVTASTFVGVSGGSF